VFVTGFLFRASELASQNLVGEYMSDRGIQEMEVRRSSNAVTLNRPGQMFADPTPNAIARDQLLAEAIEFAPPVSRQLIAFDNIVLAHWVATVRDVDGLTFVLA
jgi:hypothetical protein